MFAYCGNNSVNSIDPSGEYAAIPLPTLRDYYHMHKAVQYDIAEQYGYGIEVYVVGPEGVGRLDLYDGTTNQYYEVKHTPAARGELFEEQMRKYDSSRVAGWRFSEYTIDGKVTRGQKHISGWTTYSYWDIYYRSNGNGVIVYDWYINKARYAQYLTSVAVVASTAIAWSLMRNCSGASREIKPLGTPTCSLY